jgi:hypothetical protein
MSVRFGMALVREKESSFSEEKEAKRLLSLIAAAMHCFTAREARRHQQAPSHPSW